MQPLLRINSADNVAISTSNVEANTCLDGLDIIDSIPAGHKVAIYNISRGEDIFKYGQKIGTATMDIASGQWVHTHNMKDSAYCAPVQELETPWIPENAERFKFAGYIRSNGDVGIRNYVLVISTVICANTVVDEIVNRFRFGEEKKLIHERDDIDGVVPVKHSSGCAMDAESAGFEILQRTIVGHIKNPNVIKVVLVGLGCEVNQSDLLTDALQTAYRDKVENVGIQDLGGSGEAVAKGIAVICEALQKSYERKPCALDKLKIGLQCGGSDAFSGISANPLLGKMVDGLVGCGGTALLAETPEIIGAEQYLYGRSVNAETQEKLKKKVEWWNRYVEHHQTTLSKNPSIGNKKGGISTLVEKSLGAIAKGGSGPLCGIIDYGADCEGSGLIFMDSPGFDACSVTGLTASGCQMICFTTGRGSTFGSKPSPTFKISSTTDLYTRMTDDMDFNAGDILDGASIDDLSGQLLEAVLRACSGAPTKSELQGYGYSEFCPWQIGAVL